MRQPLISVIISSYNYGRFVGTTINSVLEQTFPAHEIIIVDDGSTDNSAEVIGSFGERVKFVQQKNQGVCVARNNGAKMATGEILAFLDSDDIWKPYKLEKQVKAFQADEEVGLVSGGVRFFDTNGETISEHLDGLSGWRAKDILLYKEPVLNSTASVIAARRDIFEKVGGFDERREMFAAEDRELCYRLAKVSKLTFIPEILVDYRIHGENGHLNTPQMERALFAFYEEAFSRDDPDNLPPRSASYSNLHKILAGCYFRSGNYSQFVKHLTRSLRLAPKHITDYLSYPVRYWKRNR